MTPTEMIEVIKAYEEGKDIEIWNGHEWIKCVSPLWNFALYNYRVKQKEKVVYQFLLRDENTYKIMNTASFYPDIEAAQQDYASMKDYKIIKKLDYTKTIIKE